MGEKAGRGRLLFLPALAFYWGLLPAALLFLARRIDTALHVPALPEAVGLAVASLLIPTGIVLSAWCTVALYLRGGGLPLAFFPPNRLVREGPYAISRHPLYLGFTLYLIGLGALIQSAAALAIVTPGFTLAWILYALLHEQRVLSRRYGDLYRDYRRETPFFLRLRRGIPGPGIVFSLVYLVGKPIVRVFFPIAVAGRENLPRSGPCILLANHASYLDPIFLIAASGRYIRFLTTAEMIRTRFGRWFFTRVGSIPTHRYRVYPSSVRALLSALNAGEIVGVFPEGERTWDGKPLSTSRTVERLLGRAGVPLIPTRIEGSYSVYPRWSGYPLPGRTRVRFFPALPPEKAADALSRISVPSGGRTWIPRPTRGIERLIWACPSCHTIGGIRAHGRFIRCQECGMEWSLDRGLHVSAHEGGRIPLSEFVSALSESEIFRGVETLTSIGSVDLSAGGEKLFPVASGAVAYENCALHVEGDPFPLSGARILKVEGRDRLDIGFTKGRRLRLKFERDSPLKWERFLRARLGIGPEG